MANGWRCFRAVFTAASPVHIGWHDLGFVQRTRYYIPARNLWGALVAGLAAGLPPPDVGDIYENATREFAANLRVTYCFPLVGGEPLLLKFEAGPRSKREKAEADFERSYLFSQTSTALDALCLTAQEGALHESEYLKRGLEFQGYVLVRSGFQEDTVKSVLAGIGVGADRKYGWGCLSGKLEEDTDPLFGAFTIKDWPDKANPRVAASSAPVYLPAHARYDQRRCFEGDLEPLSGRDWSTGKERQGSGKNIVPAALCWVPGSRLVGGRTEFEIEPQGIWK